jgi:hypothetical protein
MAKPMIFWVPGRGVGVVATLGNFMGLMLATGFEIKHESPVGPVAPDALPCNSGAYLRRVGDEGVGLESRQDRTGPFTKIALE